MTPEERNRLNDLEKRLDNLEKVQNVSFIENIKRRLDLPNVPDLISKIRMGDLLDVDDTGITNGQLLKWNSSNELYEPENDIDT